MDGGHQSLLASYGVLLDRFRSLEASHEKLKDQSDVLLQEREGLGGDHGPDHAVSATCSDGYVKNSWEVRMETSGEMEMADSDLSWAYVPGRFASGRPYRNALDCMGHAVYISRAGSGEIIYWNRPAEKLYGYKDYEAVGQRDEALIVAEKHRVMAGRIMERMRFVGSWSGQFPFKKKSGEMFLAIVTKSQLYEDGELVGVITVSSDAAVFNDLCPASARVGQDRSYGNSNSGGINLEKLQWKSRPLITSSASNLASKARSRTRVGFSTIGVGEKELNEVDISDYAKSERPPRAPAATRSRQNGKFPSAKNTFAVEGSENEEYTSESSPPCKFAQRVLAKLHIGGSIGNFGRGKDGKTQQNGVDEASFGKQVPVEPSSPQAKQANSNDRTGNLSSSVGRGDNEPNINLHCKINWEDLQLREEVGEGSFAVVYRGIWNGSDVAVKVYHGTEYNEDTLVGYSKELDIMRRLRHPNVLLFMGAVCSHEKLALVTEFLPRGSLHKTLHKNNQRLDIRRRLRMALDVARGMNYLHRMNPPIVHRDLKSSNLLVDKSWTVKVGDFGLSKLKEATFLTAKFDRGTPQWMAPEVLRNEPSTEKSDVYSFGVILWELVTESIPWKNLNLLQVVGRVGFMDQRLDIPENIDPKVSSIIQDCWQSKAEIRPSFEDIIPRMADIIQTVPAAGQREC